MTEHTDDEVVRLEIDTDELSGEQLRILQAFGMDDELSGGAEDQTFETLDDLLEFEQQLDEGYWVEWPAVRGARVLLAHPETAALAYPQAEREVREKAGIKDGELTPAALILKAAGLAAFERSVKGWEIELAGQPLSFNRVNFMRLWRSRAFRSFLADQANLFRSRPQSLGDEAGKDLRNVRNGTRSGQR